MKIVKIIAGILLVLCLLTVLAVLVFFQTVNTKRYLDPFILRASNALDRSVSVSGTGLGLTRHGVVLEVKGITVGDDQGFTSEPFLTIDQLQVGLDLVSLVFQHKTHITSVVLKAPEVHFIVSQEGRVNIQSIGQHSRQEIDTVVVTDDQKAPVSPDPSISNAASKDPSKGQAVVSTDINTIEVRDASISFIDQNSSIPLDLWLDNIDIRINDFSLNQPFELSFAACLYNNVANVHGHAQLSIELSRRSVRFNDLSLLADLSGLQTDRVDDISPGTQAGEMIKNITCPQAQLNLGLLDISPSTGIQADGKLSIHHAVVKNFNIIRVLFAHLLGNLVGTGTGLDNLLLHQSKLNAPDTAIDEAQARFSFRDQSLSIDNAEIQTDIFEFTAQGTVGRGFQIDLQTMLHLNTDVTTELVDEFKGLGCLADDSQRIAIGAALSGRPPHLKYKPNKDFRKKSRRAMMQEGANILGVLLGGSQVRPQTLAHLPGLVKRPRSNSKIFLRVFFHGTWVAALILAAVCAGLYWPSRNAQFVLDDYYTVVHDPLIKNPSLYSKIWVSRLFDAHPSSGYIKFGYYRPVLQFSWILDYRLFSLQACGYQAIDLLIHALNCFLVFLLLSNLLGRSVLAFKASLLFAVLPTQEWVVRYVTGRGDELSALFALGALIFLVRALQTRSRSNYLFVFFLLVLSALSREVAISYILYAVLIFLYHRGDVRTIDRFSFWWIMIGILPLLLLWSIVPKQGNILAWHVFYLSLAGLCLWMAQWRLRWFAVLFVLFAAISFYQGRFWTTEENLLRHTRSLELWPRTVVDQQLLMKYDDNVPAIQEMINSSSEPLIKAMWLRRLGVVFYSHGDPTNARKYFFQALSVNPLDIDSLNALAVVYHTQGRELESLNMLDRSLTLDSSYPDTLRTLGIHYFLSKDYSKARFFLNRCLYFEPDNSQARALLASLPIQ